MATYGHITDAYLSIYEGCGCDHKEDKKKKRIKEALDTLAESGIIDSEEIELLEMRRMDKEAGKKPGGTQDPALRAGLKLKAQMMGGRQKKKVPGEKKPNLQVTPRQKLEVKRKRERDAKNMMHSPRD